MDSLPNNDLGGGPIIAGSPAEILVPLVSRPRGEPETGLAGDEAVSALAIPGPGLPAAWTIAAAWADSGTYPPASAPTLALSWDGAETSPVDPGTYYIVVAVAGRASYRGTVTLLGGADAGGAIAPTPLISTAEFKARVGSWPAALQTAATATGLRRTLSLATGDLYEAIADRYAEPWRHGAYGDTYRADFLAAIGTTGNLTATNAMKDYVAFKALWYLTALNPGSKDSNGGIRAIAATAERSAAAALRRVVAVVVGYPAPVVMGGQRSVVRG